MQRVGEVKSVDIFGAAGAAGITIQADGTVPTSGWKNPALGAWVYIAAPDDGIQDFDFYAEEPKGIVSMIVRPIAAELTLTADVANFWGPGKPLIGVRVHSRSNSMEARVADKKSLVALSGGGDLRPWPWADDIKNHAGATSGLVSDLVGKSLRVYHTGDPITFDYRPDRADIELSPGASTIVRVWFG